MVTVKQRAAVLLAAFALVIGCACALAMPQQQAYAANMKLVAGTTFGKATDLPLTASGLTSSNKTVFNSALENNFYKFTTSSRKDSRYQLTVRTYSNEGFYGTIYNATHHRLANIKIGGNAVKKWVFSNLTPNSVYYIELWRFITDTSDFVVSGDINGYGLEKGQSLYVYVPYKIILKEVVAKPQLGTVKVWSNKKHTLKLKWGEPPFNTDGVEIKFWWKDDNGKTQVFYRTATKNSYSSWVRHSGKNYPYHVKARAFMNVNGKRVYGKWAKMITYRYNKYASLDTSTGKYTGKYVWQYSDAKLVKYKKVYTAAGKRWLYKWTSPTTAQKKEATLIIKEK